MRISRRNGWPRTCFVTELALCTGLLVTSPSCGNQKEAVISQHSTPFAPCPDSPNCVSSDSPEEGHRIEPYRIANVSPSAAWSDLQRVVESRPRTAVVRATDSYLHVEESSRILGFIDDVEFQLRPSEGIIAVRSASRVGHSDLGVNRRRVEEIREALRAEGVIR